VAQFPFSRWRWDNGLPISVLNPQPTRRGVHVGLLSLKAGLARLNKRAAKIASDGEQIIGPSAEAAKELHTQSDAPFDSYDDGPRREAAVGPGDSAMNAVRPAAAILTSCTSPSRTGEAASADGPSSRAA